jgi:hypothetical protein
MGWTSSGEPMRVMAFEINIPNKLYARALGVMIQGDSKKGSEPWGRMNRFHLATP